MFTLLPSIYFVAVHYIRRWNSPYYYEEENSIKEEEEKQQEQNKSFDTQTQIKPSNDLSLIESDANLLLNTNPPISNDISKQLTRSESPKKNGYLIPTNDEDEQHKTIKLRAKKSHHSSSLLNVERRKTFTGNLTEDDIVYLMNETGFTREQILLWYSDFLVCNRSNLNIKHCHICAAFCVLA